MIGRQDSGRTTGGSTEPTTPGPRVLDDDEVARRLGALPGWHGDHHRLRRGVTLAAGSIGPLLEQVEAAQRELNHHARVDRDGEEVRFTVWTHALDAVTDLDVALAERINEALAGVGPAADHPRP